MRRGSLFWGVLLIVVGGVLLLDNLGILAVNVWSILWPTLVILFGARLILGQVRRRRAAEEEQVAIPLEGASRARLRIHHGSGLLRVSAGAGPGELAAGTFVGGLDYQSRLEGEGLEVVMRVPEASFFPWPWAGGPGRGFEWSFGLSSQIPLSLDIRTGASDTGLNLSELRVTELLLDTGASSTDLTLPASAGHTRVRIRAGAASVKIQAPPGVAARIRARGGMSDVSVDPVRFPRSGDYFQSPDYESAANKAEIDVETGAGSLRVS